MSAEPKVATVMVDSDPDALAAVRRWLAQVPEIEVVGEFGTGIAAVNGIGIIEPAIIISATEMPDLTGFMPVHYLDTDYSPALVLTGTSPEDAAKAFDLGAADFLIKPVRRERLNLAIRRALASIRLNTAAAVTRSIEARPQMKAGTVPDAFGGSILVKHHGRIVVVPIASIRRIEASGNYQRIVTRDREYMARMTVAELLSRLDPNEFVRVHRSTIVNACSIRSFRHIGNGCYMVALDDGSELRMSRMYSDVVLSAFDQMMAPLTTQPDRPGNGHGR